MNKLKLIKSIKGGSPKVRRRIPPPLFPSGIAMRLKWVMVEILSRLRHRLRAEFRVDADEDAIAQIVLAIGPALEEVMAGVPAEFVWRTAAAIAEQTSTFQLMEMSRTLRDAVGFDLGAMLGNDPAIVGMVQTFARQNAQSIMDLPQVMADRLGKLIGDSVESGLSKWEIGDLIDEAFDFAEGRAQFIADNQVGRLYAELDKHRQQAAGIIGYFWNTMRDEQVRASHASLEGMRFEWDSPPINERGEAIIPGSDWGCRCWAEADVSTMTKPEKRTA